MKAKYFIYKHGNKTLMARLVVSKKQARDFEKAFNALEKLESKEPSISKRGWVKNFNQDALEAANLKFKVATDSIYKSVSHQTLESKPDGSKKEANDVFKAIKTNEGISCLVHKSSAKSATKRIGVGSAVSMVIGFCIGAAPYVSRADARSTFTVGLITAVVGITTSIIYWVKRRKMHTLNLAKEIQSAMQNAISGFRTPRDTPPAEPVG